MWVQAVGTAGVLVLGFAFGVVVGLSWGTEEIELARSLYHTCSEERGSLFLELHTCRHS